MKKSKLCRGLTVFLVILGVLVVLFGCLSPLLFQRDKRLVASAETVSASFHIAFKSDDANIDVYEMLNSAALNYVDSDGSSVSYDFTINQFYGYIATNPISFNKFKQVVLTLDFKSGYSIVSGGYSFNGSYPGCSLSRANNTIGINLNGLATNNVSIIIKVNAPTDSIYYQISGIYLDSNSVNVSDYVASASFLYFDSSSATVPASAAFSDQADGSMRANPSRIYVLNSSYPVINLNTAYGVQLSSVSVVVGTGGINGTNHGGVLVSIKSANHSKRSYTISISFGAEFDNLMNVYIIPTFKGSPDTDAGYDAGYDDGYGDGYDAGYDSGRSDGYDEGYEAGNVNASQQFNKGYNTGYNDGYSLGLAAGQNTTWESLNVVSLFLSPVNSFLATPLFGSFSIGTAFSVVLVVLLAGIFIKMFAGG